MLSPAGTSRTGEAPVARLSALDSARMCMLAVVLVGLLATYAVPALRAPTEEEMTSRVRAVEAAVADNDCMQAAALTRLLKCGPSHTACVEACAVARAVDTACRERFNALATATACVPRTPTTDLPCVWIQQTWWPWCSGPAMAECVRGAATAVVRSVTVGGKAGDVALASAWAMVKDPKGPCRGGS